MIVGFTGTRAGCTQPQYDALHNLLSEMDYDEFHHGACLGADEEAALLAIRYCTRVVAHPGISARGGGDYGMQSRVAIESSCAMMNEKSHFARNRAIVQSCDVLVACPRTMEEENSGGTWYTIHHAKKVGKRVVIVWPDGRIEDSEG